MSTTATGAATSKIYDFINIWMGMNYSQAKTAFEEANFAMTRNQQCWHQPFRFVKWTDRVDRTTQTTCRREISRSQNRRSRLIRWLFVGGVLFTSPCSAFAQLAPIADDTLGNEQTIISPNTVIDGLPSNQIDGGAQRGTNLFHSFREFNIDDGRGVYFTNPAGITNILTRVTGGNQSQILGTLGVLGNANLFLINPNGILFGPNAQLDISGSFLASTANSFKFPDDREFSATNPQAPPLLTINVPLGLQYGPSRSGTTITNRGDLRAGQDLQLMADKLDLQGQLIAGRDLVLQAQDTVVVRDTALNPFVARSGGNLTIQGNQGIDILALSHPQQTAFISRGNLSLLSDGLISGDAHFSSGGDFRIQSLSRQLANFTSLYDPIISSTGNVDVAANYSGASLLIESQGSVRVQGTITIDAPDAVSTFMGGDSILGTQPGLIIRSGQPSLVYGGTSQNNPPGFTGGTVPAGITLASAVRVQPNAQGGLVRLTTAEGGITFHSIDASSRTGGNGGIIELSAKGDITNTGSFLDPFGLSAALGSFSYTTTGDSGNGGSITLFSTLGNITVNNAHSPSYSYSASGNAGSGGNISFSSNSGNITLNNWVSNSNAQADSGNAGSGGNITLSTTSGDITLNNADFRSDSYAGSGSAGSGGNIALSTTSGDIILNNARLRSDSNSTVRNVGKGGNITLTSTSGSINLRNGALIFSVTNGQGKAGNITLAAPSIALNNARIYQVGRGNITLDTTQTPGTKVSIIDSILDTQPSYSSKANKGGDIIINTGDLAISNSSNGTGIQTITGIGQDGQTGNITINTSGKIQIAGNDSGGGNTFIFSILQGEGKAGNITITGSSLSMTGGAQINSSTFGTGNAGSIVVNIAGVVELVGNSAIFTTVGKPGVPAMGNAGTIELSANSLSLTGSSKINSDTFSQGNAGLINLTINGKANFEGVSSGIYSRVVEGSEGKGGVIDFSANSLSLKNGAVVNTTTETAGQGGSIILTVSKDISLASSAQITSSTLSQGDAGTIAINTPIITFSGNSSRITASTSNSGKGGRIIIDQSQPLTISGLGELTVATTGAGKAGDIIINADQYITLTDGSQLSAVTSSNGGAGSITLNAPVLTIAGNAQILAATGGNGQGGSITLNAPTSVNLMRVQDFSPVLSVETSGAGKAGDITINSPSLTLSEQARITATATATATNPQGGGSITLNASNLNLAGIVGVFAETQGQAPAGTLRLNPYSNQPDLNIALTPSSQISASTSGSGRGGDLIVAAPQSITIAGPGKLAVETSSTGNAGNMTFTTRQLTLKDGVEISASTAGRGKAGEIGINAEAFTLSGGAKVSTNTSSSGAAGDLKIQGNDQLFVTGQGTGLFARTTPGSTGNGGNIKIDSRLVQIEDDATIAVNSQGRGIGGSISVQADRLGLNQQGSITAETASTQGGNIFLNVKDLLLLRHNSLISTTAGTAQAGGDGGMIEFNGNFIVAVPKENSDISANAYTGSGGRVDVTAQGIFGTQFRPQLTTLSDITASSTFGAPGTVAINTPDVDPNQGLVQLPVDVTDASRLIVQTCPTGNTTANQSNEFVVTGRGGLLPTPSEAVNRDAIQVELVTTTAEDRQSISPSQPDQTSPPRATPPTGLTHTPLVEAQSWQIGADGRVVLVAAAPQNAIAPSPNRPVHCP